jgi:cytochrome c5
MKSFGQGVIFVALVVCATSQLSYAVSNSEKQKSRAKLKSKTNVASPAEDPARAEIRAKYNLVQGKQIYEQACTACHATGLLAAPKFCDVQAWKPRIAKGMDVLLQHTIQSYNSMPAKGGVESLTIAECGNAVAYMVDQCLVR